MFTDEAVLASVAPICSAIDMKRLLKTSSSSGERCDGSAEAGAAGELRRRCSSPAASTSASQPGSTTVVLVASRMIAGPLTCVPRESAARRCTATWCQAPAVYMRTVSSAACGALSEGAPPRCASGRPRGPDSARSPSLA